MERQQADSRVVYDDAVAKEKRRTLTSAAGCLREGTPKSNTTLFAQDGDKDTDSKVQHHK